MMPNATSRLAAPGSTVLRRTRLLRRALAAALSLIAVAVLTACGGARNDYSATERVLPNSVNLDAGPLALRHLRIELADADRSSPSMAVLRGSFLNLGTQTDMLLRVTTPAAATVTLSPADRDGAVALPPGVVARLQHPEDPGWVLNQQRAPLAAGSTAAVTFHFASQGRVTTQVPVTNGMTPAAEAERP